MLRSVLASALLCVCVSGAQAAPTYDWAPPASSEALSHRYTPPPGYARLPTDDFGAWMRELPLLPVGSKVLLFDGREKPRQDVHAAVVAIDIGARDLQQCADAVMRLRAEYLHSRARLVEFHPDPGKPRALRFDPKDRDPDRAKWKKYLVRVFADAGSASLQAELLPQSGAIQPGDVLIQGGYPGHAVMVLDVATDEAGHRKLLLGQSYMPAQSFHVLVDPASAERAPWYDEAALDSRLGLVTPEWRPFKRSDVRRFRDR